MSDRNIWVIRPKQRVTWDIVCFVTIMICAFEIPYGLFVGYEENSIIPLVFDYVFSFVFFSDMVLNALTVREESFGGFWGWRNIGQFFSKSWSPGALQAGRKQRSFTKQPDIAKSYWRSGWFIIDLLSSIPWVLIGGMVEAFGMARLARLMRLAALLRMLRFTKGLRMLSALSRRWSSVTPAIGRFATTIFLVPWLIHVHACMWHWATGHEGEFGVLLYNMFRVLATGEPADVETSAQMFIMISAVFSSVGVVLALLGNVVSFFSSIDMKPEKGPIQLCRQHTLILGWNASATAVINQLCSDDEDHRGDLVILSSLDREEIWGEILQQCEIPEDMSIEVVEGSITQRKRLNDVHISTAEMVLILGYEMESGELENASPDRTYEQVHDLLILKSVLSCCEAVELALPKPRSENQLTVVANVSSRTSAKVIRRGVPAELTRSIDLQVIDVSVILERLAPQIIAEPELLDVYADLISYEVGDESDGGSEFYFNPIPAQAIGMTFEQASAHYVGAIIIGYQNAETLVLNPPIETQYTLQEGDEIIAISQDYDDVQFQADHPALPDPAWTPACSEDKAPQKLMLIGRGPIMDRMSRRLLGFLPPGSEVITSPELPRFEANQCIRRPANGLPRDLEDGLLELVVWMDKAEFLGADCVAVIAGDPHFGDHDAEVLMVLSALEMRLAGQGVEIPKYVVEHLGEADTDLVDMYHHPTVFNPHDLLSYV